MIAGIILTLLGFIIGYWVGRPNKVVTAVRRQILGQQAKIIDMDDPLNINLGENEEF